MSTELYWKPVPVEPQGTSLGDSDLKRILARRYWDRDGSCHEVEIYLTSTQLPYLEGLADAGVDGAKELHAAIAKHNTVSLWIAD